METERISLESENKNLSYLERMGTWVQENPTTAKILGLAGVILGGMVLIGIPVLGLYKLSIPTAAMMIGCGCGFIAGVSTAFVFEILKKMAEFFRFSQSLENKNIQSVRY